MSNLYSLIQSHLGRHTEKIAIDDGALPITSAQLDTLVARYARALLSLAVQPGDRVAVQVEKSAENIVLYLACLRIGGVYLPLNSAYRAAEVEYFLSDARPRIFITTPDRETELQPVARKAEVTTLLTLGTRNDGSLPVLSAAQQSDAPTVERRDDDLAVICYTSGTTGRSKGAMITHGNLISNALALIDLWGFSDGDVLLHALPLYHIHGLFVALHCALLSGTKILLQQKFEVAGILAALPRATVMMGVPTFYTRLLSEPTFTRESARS